MASENAALLDGGQADNLERAISNTDRSGYGTIRDPEDILDHDLDHDTTWRAESKLLLEYSAPLLVTYILQYSYSLATVYVAGQLGTDELAASSLAASTASITGHGIYEGFAMALDTLTSQAYGAGKKKLVGLHVQRVMALMVVLTIPVGIAWMSSPWILARLIPQKELADLAGSFLRVYLIGAPGYAIFEAGKRFTQAQGNFTASLAVAMICAPLNVLWNWLFVFQLQMGFRGAALAAAVSNTLQPILLLLYVVIFARDTLECWPGLPIKAAFQNWGPMINLGVPGVITVLSEWLTFEILVFTSSYLGTEFLAAQSVLSTVCIIMYHIPMPVAVAASTRFGHLIGFGALRAARTAFRSYYVIFFIIGAFDIVLLTSLRHVVATIFSDDVQVRKILVSVLPILAILQMADSLTAISNALLRGLGRQRIGGWVNLSAYYLIGIPLALFLTFGPAKLALAGLWIGPSVGLALVTCILFCYMKYFDWQEAVDEARARHE